MKISIWAQSNADICKKAVDHKFIISGGYSADFYGRTAKDSRYENCNSTKSPAPSTFLCWKRRFKKHLTTCSDFPSEALLWIKEVEMDHSLEELNSSRSIAGKNFPNFEMLDARIASALNKIIPNSQFKKTRFLRGRHIALWSTTTSELMALNDTVLDYADLFSVTHRDDNVQEFDTRWDEVLSISKIPSDDILEGLYKLRIRESEQLKIVSELYEMEIH